VKNTVGGGVGDKAERLCRYGGGVVLGPNEKKYTEPKHYAQAKGGGTFRCPKWMKSTSS